MKSIRFCFACSIAFFLSACGQDPMEPPPEEVTVTVQAGNNQFGSPQGQLNEPLQVMVSDPVTKRPVEGVLVTWRVVTGTGAILTPPSAESGSNGIASTNVRLGAEGPYEIEATASHQVGDAPRFSVRAVPTPQITAIAPLTANGGDTITITGTNFSTTAADNTVLFSGFRGRVFSATATQLRVIVPACVPSRSVFVVASLGAVASNAQSMTVNGSAGSTLQLNRAETRVFVNASDLECQRIPAASNAAYLIIPQNISEVIGSETHFELIGLASGAPVMAQILGVGGPRQEFGSLWELRLRKLERLLGPRSEPEPGIRELELSTRAQIDLGDRRTFKVFNKDEKFVNVTAEVKFISQRAIIYQDLNAPANGFGTSDFQTLGATFDSPTYETDVTVFGQPSDIDNNQKVIILLTPLVNELTPRGASGFVAGFFFGCDLQTTTQCSGSNRSEMFYGFVPDITGRFSDIRSTTFILRELRPVLAHEFQHMISFGSRKNLDALWLSEGLAHHAEDLVADAYERGNDFQTAQQFRAQNYARASLYLRDSTAASLLSEELPGSLQQRGAAWLMVKYLATHYGGNTLLNKLARGPESSVQNVTVSTGKSWSTLMSDWAVALWADDAPDLAGASVRPEHVFPDVNLRTRMTNPVGAYALQPVRLPFDDFVIRGKLAAGSQRHVLMEAGTTPKPVNLAFTGQRGGAFNAQAVTQVTIMRVR